MATAVKMCVTNDVTNETIGTEPTDLHLLKEVSERLNLATRRPSTVQWKQVIEFRKSMGLYSSDVEPEFLDKIVEAKLKGTESTKRRKDHVTNGQKPNLSQKEINFSKSDSKLNEEDRINNNLGQKSTKDSKLTKNKKYKFFPKRKNHQKSPEPVESPKISPQKVEIKIEDAEKDLKNKFIDQNTKKPESCVPEIVSNSNENKSPLQLDTPTKSNCDIIRDFIPSKRNGPIAGDESKPSACCDTDDEFDEDTSGLSEMGKRYYNINKALAKIRRDLITMRMEDNILARKLLDARSQINIIKAQQSCDAYADVIDDVTYELEEEDLLPGLVKACDLPSRPPGSLMSAFSPLRNIGISRMNLNRRRFSIR